MAFLLNHGTGGLTNERGPCGSQAFIDGGWHATARAVSDSTEVSGASNGRSGYLKERFRPSQKPHSFPPHLGLNNAPVKGLEVAGPDALTP